jgi:hypothetical protein
MIKGLVPLTAVVVDVDVDVDDKNKPREFPVRGAMPPG